MKKTKLKQWLWLVGVVAILLVGCQNKPTAIKSSTTSTTSSTAAAEEVTVDWPFYEIKKEGQVVGHILGTMHIGQKEMYPFPEVILTSLKNSQLLLTEVKMADLEAPDPELMMAVMQGDKPITEGMNEESLRIFRERLKEYGFEEEAIKMLNRLGVDQFLQTKYISPIAATYGVDMQLYGKAKNISTLKNEGLETVEEQYDILLEAYKEPADVNEWVATIPSLKEGKDSTDKLVKDYIAGEVFKYFEEEASDQEMNAAQQALLIDQRNANWLKVLPNYLEESGVFIAVGAGHLPTDKGILHLLEAAGYQTTKVSFN
ncbi:TraB/GumN family protein [Vagococcus sp. BWB3-3]|uniref:TraB/GumN family protein n=1 Tax=Vagococcus allomyrinae TaxID=2794353 RepID=A0A940PE68_9ENTE|nr:TraB/GumN family protein [Vagococcus allomyrinae]MBP1041183.1 TraB/GumN family protein [Vagococcus allomyrinae]